MPTELIIFLAMVGTFLVCAAVAKLPSGVGLVAAAIVGTIVGGFGVPIADLAEGTFAFLDTILTIACAMVYMKCIQNSGMLDALNRVIIKRFNKMPALLLICLMLIIMFPGMITGSSTAAVISAGVIVAPLLLKLGIPKVKTAAIIALGGMFGATAPPVNMAVMAIGSGIDMPYMGFTLPLSLLAFPLAIAAVLFLGLRDARRVDRKLLLSELDEGEKIRALIFLPLLVLIALMVLPNLFPAVLGSIGMPVVFLLSAVVSLFTGKRMNVLRTAKEAIESALPVMAILFGVGMFIQAMTMTGVKGWIVVQCISVPSSLLYLTILVSIALFGAISSLGAASVLGVPFLLALIDSNQIMVAAGIASLASLGELMPPTALAGIFAAKVVGVEKYTDVIKKCLLPAVGIAVVSLLFIIYANDIAALIK